MKRLILNLSILILFSALFSCSTTTEGPQTIILISADGFRPDYLQRGITPNLTALAEEGVAADGMRPVFPSKTFTNYYAIATGLYPSHNGIFSNNMKDKESGTRFSYGPADSTDTTVWWKGEPIWVTVEKQGKKAACYFWVGSDAEIDGTRPSYWYRYDGSVPNTERVETVLEWLDLPPEERPSLITLYFNDTDNAGHRYGPDAPETNEAIALIDSTIGLLFDGLRSRNLYDTVNIMFVSDHGMAALDSSRVVFWDDVLDPSDVWVIDQGPLLTLDVPEDKQTDVRESLISLGPHVTVPSEEELSERFHLDRTPRTPDIIAIADEGWMIMQRSRMRRPVSGGTHGYDNTVPSMQATFVAHGPVFQSGLKVDRVYNVDLYELMTHILSLDPAPNDGSFERIRPVLR